MKFTEALAQLQAPARVASYMLTLAKLCENVPDIKDNTAMQMHATAFLVLQMAGLTSPHHLLQRVDRACAVLMMLEEYDMHEAPNRTEKTLERSDDSGRAISKLAQQAQGIVDELRALVRDLHRLTTAPGTSGAATVEASAAEPVKAPETPRTASRGVDVVRLPRRGATPTKETPAPVRTAG